MIDYEYWNTPFSYDGKHPLKGTLIDFSAFVPAGYADSGWHRQALFIHGSYLNREDVVKAIRSGIRATGITKVEWETVELFPFFGVVEWWMAIYKAKEVLV